jgi:hypothetical protein
METVSGSGGCPLGFDRSGRKGVVMSTNWDYLDAMKMNETAPAPNLTPITRQAERRRFVPWFWPDEELGPVVELRKKSFLKNPDHVLATSDDDPIVRSATQQLLWLQGNYLAENFPDKYTIETHRKVGRTIVNKVTDDQFSLRPEADDWHPLAISGLLGQEDICVVKRKKAGKHVLVAGFLATPTNWNLSAFMGEDMDGIHHQVKGYHKPLSAERTYRLKETVDKVLESLRPYPDGGMARNNQFVMHDDRLALELGSSRPFNPEKVSKNPIDNLVLRSERESLVRLPAPYDDFTIFTIKPNVFSLRDVARERGSDFARAIVANCIVREGLQSADSTYDFTQSMHTYMLSGGES